MTNEEIKAKVDELNQELQTLNPQWEHWIAKRDEAQGELRRIQDRRAQIRTEQLKLMQGMSR